MWRRWYGACFAVSASALVMLYFAVLLLDPFSTGRFTPIDRVDIATRVPQYANAGRVRDPQFDAAMIGNSHALTINPRNLSAATGRRFVLLAAAGSLPPHLLTVARAFQQHHRAGSSVVLMLDDFWCFAQGEARPYPFPTWLYVSPTGEFLRHVLFPRAIEAAALRAAMLLGLAGSSGPEDGYVPPPQSPNLFWDPARLAAIRPATVAPPPGTPYPSLDALAEFVSELAAQSRLLLVLPPVYRTALPQPGSAADRRLGACKARMREIVASRPNIAYIDLHHKGPIADDAENFFDVTHFGEKVTRIVEEKIAAAYLRKWPEAIDSNRAASSNP